MKVYLDCSPLIQPQVSGIGVYNKNLFLAMKPLLGENLSAVLKWNRFNKVSVVKKHLETNIIALPPLIFNTDIIYHGTDHKINTYSRGPKVVTIHDMQPFVDKWLDPNFAKKRREVISKVLNSDLQRIIAVSDFTKQEIIKFFPKLDVKIDVIHHGYNFHNGVQNIANNKIEKLIAGRPFLLFVGNIEERKNLINQIHAFEILKKTHPDLLFILAGNQGYNFHQVNECIEKSPFKNSIHLVGYLTEDEKNFALKNTSCLMFASWYEGFGIPVIEALAFNTNIIISNTSSLVEIAGDYCHQCNPADTEDIAEKLSLIIKYGNIKKIDLNEWQNHWNWANCAKKTIATYQKISN